MLKRAGLLVGLAALLAAGCARQVEQVATVTPSSPPTPTVAPTASPTPVFTQEAVSEEGVGAVTFRIVYDNNAYDQALQTAWGFACVVETAEGAVLFDTGGDGIILLSNMAAMGVVPQAIDAVVLSHIHGDHTGGLAALLDAGARPTVYVPAAFPASFKDTVRARTDLVEVTEPQGVSPGIHTTGEVGAGIIEQALVVETAEGLVVVTGCAHPGVVAMVRRAKETVAGKVALVMGGFHLGGASAEEVESIVADFRQLGVRQIAPCHCTGDRARRIFAEAYGADCFLVGVGWVTTIGTREEGPK